MKTNRIEFRVSLLDKTLLELQAEKCGLSLGEYLTSCGLSRQIVPLPGEERLGAYLQLKKFEVQFKYISNLIKNRQEKEVINAVANLSAELKEHLEFIKNGQ